MVKSKYSQKKGETYSQRVGHKNLKVVSRQSIATWLPSFILSLAAFAISGYALYIIHLRPSDVKISAGRIHLFSAKYSSKSMEGILLLLSLEISNSGARPGMVNDVVLTMELDSGKDYLFEPHFVIDYSKLLYVAARLPRPPFWECIIGDFCPFLVGGGAYVMKHIVFSQNRGAPGFCVDDLEPGRYRCRLYARVNNGKWRVFQKRIEDILPNTLKDVYEGGILQKTDRNIQRERTKSKIFESR